MSEYVAPPPGLQARVDDVLVALEADIPALQHLRRMPMDMVAVAVYQQTGCEQPDDARIAAALRAIAARNRIGGYVERGDVV